MAKGNRVSEIAEIYFTGKEYKPTDFPNGMTGSSWSRCMSWLSYKHDNTSAHGFLITWMTQNEYSKRDIADIKAYEPNRILFSAMALARMSTTGFPLTEKYENKIRGEISKALSAVSNDRARKDEERRVAQSKIPLTTARDRSGATIGDFEEAIDAFWANDYRSDFSPSNYFKLHHVKLPVVKMVSEYYERVLEELKNPDQEYTVEVITPVGRRKWNRYVQFIELIVRDCRAIIGAKIAEAQAKEAAKPPRKVKVKTPEQLTSRMRFCTEAEEFKLKSLPPSTIIGAKQVWMFNRRNRVLFVYNAVDGKELSVNGSALLNWDILQSEAKKLRKPDEVLPGVTGGGKIALRKLMSLIKAKSGRPNGRTNTDLVILRVIR